MKTKKDARWKVLVVAFVLIFAGFAAMMVTPTVLAEESPEVTTEPAEDVTPHTAVLNMSFTMGDIEEVTVWFEYNYTGEDPEIPVGEAVYTVDDEVTTHSHLLDDLVPETEYDFVAVLQYYDEEEEEDVTLQGNIETFMTGEIVEEPTVSTEPAEDITPYSATLNMAYTLGDAGQATVQFLGNETGETLEKLTESVVYEDGEHEYVFDDLAPWTEYEYQAVLEYVDSDGETVTLMGDVLDFTTGSEVTIDGPEEAYIDEDVTFEAVVIGEIDEYSWSIVNIFGDEVDSGEDDTLTTVFEDSGMHTITVEVVDVNGIEDDDMVTIDVFAEVTLTVVDDETDDPVEGADVGLDYVVPVDPEEDPLHFSDYDYTGADGQVIFSVDVPVFEDGLGDEIYGQYSAGHTDYVRESGEFTGTSYEIRLTPRTEWTVEVGPIVEVIDPADDPFPVPEAEVTLTWNDQEMVTETGSDGIASFAVDFNPDTDETEFDAQIWHEDYLMNHTSFVGSSSFAYRIAEGYYFPEILLEEHFTFEIGPVVDEDGDPIDRVQVTIMYDEYYAEDETLPDGIAVFNTRDIFVNPYDEGVDATFYHEDYMTKEAHVFPDEEVVLLPRVAVTVGPVVDQEGEPVSGATVTLVAEEWQESEDTDADGNAVFYPPFDPEGVTFTYTISHWDLEEDVTGTFTGTSSGEIEIEIEEDEPVDEPISTAVLAGVGIIIIIIIVIIVVMMMRKKPVEAEEEEELFEEEDLFEEEEEDLFEEEEDLFEEEEEDLFEEEEEDLFEEEEEDLFEEEEEDLFEEEEEEL